MALLLARFSLVILSELVVIEIVNQIVVTIVIVEIAQFHFIGGERIDKILIFLFIHGLFSRFGCKITVQSSDHNTNN